MRCSLLGFRCTLNPQNTPSNKKQMCVMLWFYLKQFILDYCLIWHVNLYTWDEKWKAKLAQSDHFRFPNAFKIDKNLRLFTLWLCNIVYIYCPTCVPSESVFTCSRGPQSQNYDWFVYPSSVRDVKCTYTSVYMN